MKEILKKLLSGIVAFALLLGSVPVYAANEELMINGSGQMLMVSNFDAKGAWGMKDPKWYPDENGIIEVPVLDRNNDRTYFGIAIQGTPDLDYSANKIMLDFSAISDGKVVQASSKYPKGAVPMDSELREALISKVTTEGSVDVPLSYTTADDTEIASAVIRFVNRHDLTVNFINGNGESKPMEDGEAIELSLNEKGQFTATAADGFLWSSSSPDIVQIDEETGEITALKGGMAQIFLGDGEQNIFTCDVTVADEPAETEIKVFYESETGAETEIQSGSTFEVPLTAAGTFRLEGWTAPEGKSLIWGTDFEETSQKKPIWIGTNSGEIYVAGPGTVSAWAKVKDDLTLTEEETLFEFNITAEQKELQDIKITVNEKEVQNGGSFDVQGSEWTEISVTGKYGNSEEYVPVSNGEYTLETDSEDVDLDTVTMRTPYFSFLKPGTAEFTLRYGEDKEFTFSVTSQYVAIESVKLELPEETFLHKLLYRYGDGENYPGIEESTLVDSIHVTPSNASYKDNITWTNDNEEVATYMSIYNNGFVAHKAGETTITATVQDNDKTFTDSQKVKFVYLYPIEKLEAESTKLTVSTDGTKVKLPIIYTPEHPSQALIEWSQSGDGEVEILRGKNGMYSEYSNSDYSIKGIKEGKVVLTGVPAAAKEGTNPSIVFEIQVTGGSGEVPEIPNTDDLVNDWKTSLTEYYQSKDSYQWSYGKEWDVIGLERFGLGLEICGDSVNPKEDYLLSVKEEMKDEYGQLTLDGKPTDIARTAIAVYALGEDPKTLGDVDLIDLLVNSDKISDGVNEPVWTLLALDAAKEEVSADAKWNRESLIDEILTYQQPDGSFPLSKTGGGGSTVDLTAMTLQALARYQSEAKVKNAIDKALEYLKENMIDECDYGTVETDAQVAIALLMLGIDPSDPDSGFTDGNHTIFTAIDQYQAEDGGFKHKVSDDSSMGMSTQQVLLAAASWERYVSGTNDIYDMTDVLPEQPDDIQEQAQKVIDLIEGIGEVTLDSKNAIEAARKAYDGLNEDAKKLVTNYNILTEAEEKLKELENEEQEGTVIIAVEKFSIGQGYIVEPVEVDLKEGQSIWSKLTSIFTGEKKITAARVLVDILEKEGIDYRNTGDVDDNFYLSGIIDTEGSLTAEFPSISQQYAQDHGIALENPRNNAKLGEFDYSSSSGWVYTLNNEFPDVGLSGKTVETGDVIRVRFTAMGYGADLGRVYNGTEPFVPKVNGDSLTKLLAQVNSSENKDELLGFKNVKDAYENAIKAISNIENDQTKIDQAEKDLSEALENPQNPEDISKDVQKVIKMIDDLGQITLESKPAIDAARAAYDALSEEGKKLVTNYAKLTEAESKYEQLQEQDQNDRKAAKEVMDYISAIGNVTKESKEAIEKAREAYDKLTEKQKSYVTNLDVLEAAEEAYKKLSDDNEGNDKDPVYGVTLTDSKYQISVYGENLSDEMSLKVTPLQKDDDEISLMSKEIPSSKSLTKLYRISIWENGKQIDPDGPFTISYAMGDKYNGQTLEVLVLNNQGNSTKIKGKVENGKLSVVTENLGCFGVIIDSSSSEGGKNDGNANNQGSGSNTTGKNTGSVKTGDETPVELYLIFAGVSVVALVIAGKKRYCRR